MIQEGMLWFDDTPGRAVAEVVQRAAVRYNQKHGRMPNVCYVHPGQLDGEAVDNVAGIKVVASESVLPHHFWMGIGDNRDCEAHE